jgi:hypothetical protein
MQGMIGSGACVAYLRHWRTRRRSSWPPIDMLPINPSSTPRVESRDEEKPAGVRAWAGGIKRRRAILWVRPLAEGVRACNPRTGRPARICPLPQPAFIYPFRLSFSFVGARRLGLLQGGHDALQRCIYSDSGYQVDSVPYISGCYCMCSTADNPH